MGGGKWPGAGEAGKELGRQNATYGVVLRLWGACDCDSTPKTLNSKGFYF